MHVVLTCSHIFCFCAVQEPSASGLEMRLLCLEVGVFVHTLCTPHLSLSLTQISLSHADLSQKSLFLSVVSREVQA